MVKKNILIALASIMMVASANYEQSSSSNSRVLATETIDLFDNNVMEADYARVSGSSGMSGMNHHSNLMAGSMSSQGSYGMGSVQSNSGSLGMSGMIHQSDQMVGSMQSLGSYSTGSAQRNIQQSSRRMSMPRTSQFKSTSSGSQSKPTIGYLEPEFTEADNSNTVFIQHHGSAASTGRQISGSAKNLGMQNHGSSGSYGIQNQGSSSNGMLNSGSASNYGMQNHGSSGSHGIQNQVRSSNGVLNSGSASNYGMHNHGSSGSNGIQNLGSSSNGMQGMSYQSAGYY